MTSKTVSGTSYKQNSNILRGRASLKTPLHEIYALLRLTAAPGVGTHRARALLGHFRSAEKALRATKEELCAVDGVDERTAASIVSFDGEAYADEQLARIESVGAALIPFFDSGYPDRLKQIFDPPIFLFVLGELSEVDFNSVAIVGSRQPTNYGRLVTQKLSADLCREGITIVSGLAYGIDTVAHGEAVKNGGRTLAVLGSGVDNVYPYENRKLARDIVKNGALISEFPMRADPDRQNFPRRNRIICGLSLGVVVVEAGLKSGALITAAMALEQNREVFAVPGNINSPMSQGTNELLKQGAKLVMSVEDVMEEIDSQLNLSNRSGVPDCDKIELRSDEREMMRLLSHEPAHIDDIAIAAHQPTSKALTILLSLELQDLVKQLPGKMFVRL
jgi:DNA processing protein